MGSQIEDLTRAFRAGEWLPQFESMFPAGAPSVSGSDIAYLLDKAKANLEKRRLGQATNLLALALRLNAEEAVPRIRRTGVLRASKYRYESDLVAGVVKALLERRAALTLSETAIAYFESVLTLLQLAPAARELQQWIVGELRKRKDAALKTLVVIVDLRFLMLQTPDRHCSADDPKFYAAEDYAEALSLLIHLFDTFVGIRDEHFNLLDEDGIYAGDYDAMLIAACKIKRYNEAELLIDIFSFEAARKGGVVRITPADIALEQSIRLGYIQGELQKAVREVSGLQGSDMEDRPSLAELVRKVSEEHESTLMSQVNNPIPRIVFHMPDVPELFGPFREDHLYAEDVTYLEETAKEQYCRPDKLLDFEVVDGLVLFDVLKIQRFLNFLGGLMGRRLLPLFRAGAPLAHRSLLAVFRIEQFRELLGRCVNMQSAAAFMRCVEYGGSQQRGMFDVQYQPVIRGKRYVLVPLNILRNANLMRNLLYLHAQKGKAEDPDSKVSMQQFLYASMRKRFRCVAESVRLKVAGQHLEIDILAIVGKTLLVIECKSPFHPCDLHELRTSYDHIVKAADQLDRLKAVLQDDAIVRPLIGRLGWSDVEYDSVGGCIVTGNRMFNGYMIRGNPVRQAYEMTSVLEEGTVTLETDVLRVWQGEEFSPEDLLGYLAGVTTHQDLFASMEPRDVTYRFGPDEMTFSTFVLIGERLTQLMRSRYPVVGKRAADSAPTA